MPDGTAPGTSICITSTPFILFGSLASNSTTANTKALIRPSTRSLTRLRPAIRLWEKTTAWVLKVKPPPGIEPPSPTIPTSPTKPHRASISEQRKCDLDVKIQQEEDCKQKRDATSIHSGTIQHRKVIP